MSQTALDTLNDDMLLSMIDKEVAFPDVPAYDDDFLMNMAQQELNASIDTQSGAPAGVRAQVAAAQSTEDKLATIKKFYPDAMPVEVFDPESGAANFGRGNFIITNPETGGLSLFDEDVRLFGMPIPTLADFADAGPEIAEIVGGLTAGTLAAGAAATATAPTVLGTVPAATAAFVAGEGIGSAAAREAYISILDYFGETEDNRGAGDRLSDFATTAVFNAAAGPITSKVFQGVKVGVGAPVRFVTRTMSTAAKEALQKMQSAGVTNPTAGQITGSPLANLFEQYLSAVPTSVTIMKENAEQTLLQIQQEAARLAQKYGGARTTSDAAYRTMDAAQAARSRYDEKVTAMYNEVGELVGNVTSDAASTKAFVDKYFAASKTATGSPDVDPALELAAKVLRDAGEGKLGYNELKSFRSSLMATVRKAESQGALNASERKVKELIGFVTSDLDNLVKSAGNAQMDLLGGKAGKKAQQTVLDKYKAAGDFVRENMRKGGDIAFIDKVIKSGEQEATGALRLVLGGSKEGAERLEKMRRQFTPEEFNVLSGYMLGKMGMPNAGSAGASEMGEQALKEGAEAITEAGFSPNTFIRNWNNLSKESKEALFGGTEYKDLAPALDNLVFTVDRVGKSASDMANPSGTARLLGAMGTFGPIAAASGAGMAGEGFEYGFAGLIAPYASAKLMTNKAFVNWLAEGVEKAAYNPQSFGQHIRRLGQISAVNPDIRDEVRAVIQGLTQDAIEPIEWQDTETLKESPAEGIPVNNEAAFRQSVPKSTADKVLPSREDLMAQMQSIDMPDVGAPMFEPLPSMGSGSFSGQSGMSPTILPNDADRELASRLQTGGGIAGLV